MRKKIFEEMFGYKRESRDMLGDTSEEIHQVEKRETDGGFWSITICEERKKISEMLLLGGLT